MTDKSDGEIRRDRIVEILGENYGLGFVDRAALARKLPGWGNAHLDNALHVLKKRNIVYKDDLGYELTTAPEGYNERLVAERNAAVGDGLTDDTAAIQALCDAATRKPAGSVPDNPKPVPTPAPEAPSVVWTCGAPGCGVIVDHAGQLCTGHQPRPFDPVVRMPAGYNERLVAERNAAPEAVVGVSSLDSKPIDPLAAPLCAKGCTVPVLNKGDLCDFCTNMCDGCYRPSDQCGCKELEAQQQDRFERNYGTNGEQHLDPIAVRNALTALRVRVTRSVDDKELKLEVLDYLGRILDDSIEAVLVSIAGDLTK
jgi:hypothetical protein